MKLHLQIDFHKKIGDQSQAPSMSPDYELMKEMDITETISDDIRYIFDSWTHLHRVSNPNEINSYTGDENFFINTLDNFMNITYGVIEKKLFDIFGFTEEEIKNGVFIEDVTINDGDIMEAHVDVYVD